MEDTQRGRQVLLSAGLSPAEVATWHISWAGLIEKNGHVDKLVLLGKVQYLPG
jgi:hypothetical protein